MVSVVEACLEEDAEQSCYSKKEKDGYIVWSIGRNKSADNVTDLKYRSCKWISFCKYACFGRQKRE